MSLAELLCHQVRHQWSGRVVEVLDSFIAHLDDTAKSA